MGSGERGAAVHSPLPIPHSPHHNSLTKNSGVTISGTKNPAAVLNNFIRAWRCTLARWPKFQVTR